MADLLDIAKQVPLGFECRSCGRSAHNWLARIGRFLKTGETCCADLKDWCARAERGDPPRALRDHPQQIMFSVQEALRENKGHKLILNTYQDEAGRICSDYQFICPDGRVIEVTVRPKCPPSPESK